MGGAPSARAEVSPAARQPLDRQRRRFAEKAPDWRVAVINVFLQLTCRLLVVGLTRKTPVAPGAARRQTCRVST